MPRLSAFPPAVGVVVPAAPRPPHPVPILQPHGGYGQSAYKAMCKNRAAQPTLGPLSV